MKRFWKIPLIIMISLFLTFPAWAADEEITDFTELDATPAVGDLLVVVDVSDTTDSDEGTTKKITTSNLFGGLEPELSDEASLYSTLSDVTQFVEAGDAATLLDGTNWRLFYVNGSGDVVELALGAANTFLGSDGASTAPSFQTLVDADVPDTITIDLATDATTLETPRAIGGVNFDGSAAITPTTIVVADTEDATTFVGLWDSATGSLLPKSDEQITYVANTGVLTAAGFAGPLTGAVIGNADSSTEATLVVNDATAENNLIPFVEDADVDGGVEGLEVDTDFHYNPSTGTVTATNFAGIASSATALATTRAIGGVNFDGTAAITPTTIVVADTEDATTFVGLWDSATGSLLPKTDETLTYVANTGVLTSTGFAGALNGTVGATTPAAGAFTTVTTSSDMTIGTGGDPADAGTIRLKNGDIIAWEDGTETTITHVNDKGLAFNTPIYILEQADANADTDDYGQIWINTATPNELWFTDDAGTDFRLGTPTNVTPVDTGDENASFYPILVDGATGTQATETDGELTYNPSTGLLTIAGVDASGTVSANLLTPDAADSADIGTVDLEFSDLFLGASAVIYGEVDQSATLTSSASLWTANNFGVTTQFKLPSSDADPTATAGYMRHDSTVSNFTNGAVTFYDGAAIKQIVSMTTATATACTDDQVVAYDADADLWYCKDDTSAGAPSYDTISDPEADQTIAFANDEITEWTFADTDEDMFTISGQGAYGDVAVLLVQQETGDATDGTVLEVISTDVNVDPLVVSTAGQAGALVVAQNTGIVNIAAGADINDADVTSVDKLEGVDNAVYIDMGGDGIVEIESDTTVSIEAANIDLRVDSAAYLSIDTADAGATTISQTSDGQDKIILGDGADATQIIIPAGPDDMADDNWSGIAIKGPCGEAIAEFEVVVWTAAATEFMLADADAATLFPARGIAVEEHNDGWETANAEELTVLVQGVIRNEGWTWGTIGGPLYLSDTAGALSETAPSTENDCAQTVGWVIDDTHIYVNFTPHWVIVGP